MPKKKRALLQTHSKAHRVRKSRAPQKKLSSVAVSSVSSLHAPVADTAHHFLPALPQLSDSESLASPSPFPGGKPLTEHEHKLAEDLHDWILGGQDGIVNTLGVILAIAVITPNKYIVLAAGLAALFAETISMSTVAYTSVKASRSYYESECEEQRNLIKENPYLQREVLIDAYERKGLSRTDAHRIVTELTKDERVWLEMLMEEHLHLYAPDAISPLRSALIVGTSATVGSLIPLLPFFFAGGTTAIMWSAITSVIILFCAGALSAKITIGNWKARGFEMALIGSIAAIAGSGIGWLLIKSGVSVF